MRNGTDNIISFLTLHVLRRSNLKIKHLQQQKTNNQTTKVSKRQSRQTEGRVREKKFLDLILNIELRELSGAASNAVRDIDRGVVLGEAYSNVGGARVDDHQIEAALRHELRRNHRF